jgi:hypothetical protein
MIDSTYGHLVPDAALYVRGLLDAYDVVAVKAPEAGEIR